MPKKTKKQRECDIQMKFFKLLDEYSLRHEAINWVHSIPYEVRVSIGQARKLKRMGMRKGVADVFVPSPKFICNSESIPEMIYHGMYLEFKCNTPSWRTKKQSEEQIEFEEYCFSQGYKYVVVSDAEEALNLVLIYLNVKRQAEAASETSA